MWSLLVNGVLLGWDPETRTRVIKVCGWGFLGGQGPNPKYKAIQISEGLVTDHVRMCSCVLRSLRSCSDVLVCVHVSQIMFRCARVCSRLSDHVHMCSCVFTSLRSCSHVLVCVEVSQIMFTCARVCSRLSDHVQMCSCVLRSLRSCSHVLVCVDVSQIMFACARVCSRLTDHVQMCSCVFTSLRSCSHVLVCLRLADASSNVRRPFLHDVYLFLNLAGPHLGGH